MKHSRALLVCVAVLAVAGGAVASDAPVTIEVVGVNMTPSVSSSADWGWWNPAKYPDGWDPDEEASFEFAELRMLVDYGEYRVILGGEWYPDLNATGSYPTADSQESTTEQLSLKGNIYDLGFGMFCGRNDRNGVLPWIGATYMDLSEYRTTTPPQDSGLAETIDRADTRIWGVVAGVDGSISLTDRLDVAGRLIYRWASGDRDAVISSQDPGSDDTAGQVELSDSIDHSMWGADLGLRWYATEQWWFEAGWRYRDRTLDDGPASFGGPQIKMAMKF